MDEWWWIQKDGGKKCNKIYMTRIFDIRTEIYWYVYVLSDSASWPVYGIRVAFQL